MIRHHLVLDTPTILALAGNRQVSALVHRAHFEPDTRLWVPTLALLHADIEYPGLVEHVGQLDVIHTVDLDYPATLSIAELHREGIPLDIASTVHAVRNLPEWDANALVATTAPGHYEELTVPVLDLNR